MLSNVFKSKIFAALFFLAFSSQAISVETTGAAGELLDKVEKYINAHPYHAEEMVSKGKNGAISQKMELFKRSNPEAKASDPRTRHELIAYLDFPAYNDLNVIFKGDYAHLMAFFPKAKIVSSLYDSKLLAPFGSFVKGDPTDVKAVLALATDAKIVKAGEGDQLELIMNVPKLKQAALLTAKVKSFTIKALIEEDGYLKQVDQFLDGSLVATSSMKKLKLDNSSIDKKFEINAKEYTESELDFQTTFVRLAQTGK